MGGFDAQKRPEMLGPGIPDLIKALFNTVNSDVWWLVSAYEVSKMHG